MSHPTPSGVPVAPNQCLVRGRIIKVEPAPGGVGAAWSVAVEGSTDVTGSPNFARRHVGTVIPVLVHPGLKEGFQAGEVVEAKVAYEGDERGGAFFLIGQDVKRVPPAEPGAAADGGE